MACYQRHLKPYSDKTDVIVCQLMDRCEQCNTWMTKKLMERHQFGGQKQCRICKQQVDKDHQCYVQINPVQKRKKVLQLYIYFDFECSQENGIHFPNLCVAHRVCQYCDRLPIDEPCTHCQALKPRRHVFRGPHTLKEFMDWLFQTQSHPGGQASCLLHQEAIVIAHNFKGYDGQFILNHLVHTASIKPTVIMNGTKILSMQVFGSEVFRFL